VNILTNEVVIVLSQGKQMLRPIKWLPDGQADGAWGSRRWSLRRRGSTVEALDEWTPMMTWHVPAMVSSCSGNEMSVWDIFQPFGLKEVMKDLTL
jgi:hypothetical protein